jgi:hypothetical protein
METFDKNARVEYFKGEENIRDKWEQIKNTNDL